LLVDVPELASQAEDWSAWLRTEDESAIVSTLRLHTSTGRPLGSTAFLNLLENLLGRTVRPRKAGRPRKNIKGA